MIDVLFLDLGNVLVFHDNDKLFREIGRAFGRPAEQVRGALDDEFWARVNRGHYPGDALRRALCARIFPEEAERLEAAITPDRWFDLWNCHFEVNREMVRTVEGLAGRVRLVLLSNTHDQHVAFIRRRVPLLERFEALVLSCEEGFIKPEREIFERALAVGGVRPERAMFFDDVPAYAEAARSVGIQGHTFVGVDDFKEVIRSAGLST